MDANRFDDLASEMASGTNRRRAIAGIIAGMAGGFAFAPDADAKKGLGKKRCRKKRCNPRPVQAVCESNEQCCTEKTGRVCANNRKGGNCSLSNVCCLPLGAGCQESCDCCGAGSCFVGQCALL